MANFAPREVLTAARLNAALAAKADVSALAGKADLAALAGKADLDADGVLRADQIPATITTGIAAAQSDATNARTTADQAQQDATVAGTAAAAAQGTADGAVQGIAQARTDAAEALEAATTAKSDASAAKADAAAALSSRIPTAQKGIALGVATLDGTGRVPLSQLPDGLGSGSGNPDSWMTPPKAADFGWINGGISTATDTDRGMLVDLEGATTQTLRVLTRPRPGARWRAVLGLEHPALVSMSVGAGLACRSSVTGRVEHSCWLNGVDSQGVFNRQLLALRWSSTTAVQSVLATRGVITGGRLFQRLTDDGSRIIHEVSLTGRGDWLFSATSPRAEFVDADQVAIAFAAVVSTSYPTRIPLRFIHWSLEVLP